MFFEINSAISAVIWGPPMLAAFLGTGLFLSVRTKFYQIFGIGDWMKSTIGSLVSKKSGDDSSGISQFGALTSSLAACLGTGNIAGVATALCSGGAGAVFWMCISAILGMMTCCCENILGIKHRIKNQANKWVGGPAYYIEHGLGMKNLARVYGVFLICASLGMGNMTQSNSVAQGLSGFGIPPLMSGIFLSAILIFALSGGLKRITNLSQALIPILSGGFILACFIIILVNRENIIPCIELILKEAFTIKSVSGFGMAKAMRFGISRGVFSNEAGLGTCAIIHSSADCKSPSEQGKWGILEVFIDTVVMCSITAAAILTSGAMQNESADGVVLCAAVFESVFGKAGGYFLNICICLFAFCTLVAWSYYGKTGAEYLFGIKGAKAYNMLYIAAAFIGCIAKLDFVWSISDTFNGLMAVPNLFAILCLSKEATSELNEERRVQR